MRQRLQCVLCRRQPLVDDVKILSLFSPLSRQLHNMNFCIAATKSVNATEPLNHGVKRGQVAHEVVGIEVDSDLASRSGHEVLRVYRRFSIGVCAKAAKHRIH
jgi:hypothetical protein